MEKMIKSVSDRADGGRGDWVERDVQRLSELPIHRVNKHFIGDVDLETFAPKRLVLLVVVGTKCQNGIPTQTHDFHIEEEEATHCLPIQHRYLVIRRSMQNVYVMFPNDFLHSRC